MPFIDEYPVLHKKLQERVARWEAKLAQEDADSAKKKLAEQAAACSKLISNPKPKPKKRLLRERFLRSIEWLNLRKVVFERDGRLCVGCGSVENLQIDHIKPRSKFPELQLEPTNLQVLCWPCNKKKATKF